MRTLLRTGAVAVATIVLCYMALLNYTEPNEVGIAWNVASGETWLQDTGGFHVTAPWTLVAVVDTRPQRVCITSASHAAFNCRLVQFQSAAWQDFVKVEGWYYYWLSNRLSFNGGYREEYRGVRDILRGYAFSVQKYPFLKVLEDYQE